MSALFPLFLNVTVELPGMAFSKVRRYTLADALNTVPELVVEVFSTEPDLDLAELVGQPAAVLLDEPAIPRFDGVVRRVEQRALDSAGVSVYALTVVPHLWLSTQRSGHRIFQGETALGIAEAVLASYGPAMDRPQGVLFQRALTNTACSGTRRITTSCFGSSRKKGSSRPGRRTAPESASGRSRTTRRQVVRTWTFRTALPPARSPPPARTSLPRP